MADIKSILTKYIPDIDNTVKSFLSDAPNFMHGVISYHFGWVDQDFQPATVSRGKMFRPTINLLVFEALTGDHRGALPVAASIEMIHNFSLLHDDIEDGDIERRGRPTAWTIWGQPLIINVGDYLYSLAYKTMYGLDEEKFSPETRLTVFKLMNDTCLDLTKGQDLDMRFETMGANVSTEMYLDMVYKKTGALVNAAILSAAILGTTDQNIIEGYEIFAKNIGRAFQIQDDILGIWGDSSQTGKSSNNDLYRKKKTLPIIYMFDQATGDRKQQLMDYYASDDPLSDDAIVFVRESLAETGAKAYAQEMANTLQTQAFAGLTQTGINNQAQRDLEAIARFLIDRSY